MKRIAISIIAVMMTLSALACAQIHKKPAIYIEKAQLSDQEESIVQLLGANREQHIYDFKLDNHVKSVQVNTYELIDGAWKLVGGGESAFSDEKGRLALYFENIVEGLSVAIQSKNSSGSTHYSTESTQDFTGITRATTALHDLTEIVYEQEIPLVIQILTSQNSVNLYGVEYFFTPNLYEKHGYEHIYAITVRFSQKTVDE